jgi:hypothetical protein
MFLRKLVAQAGACALRYFLPFPTPIHSTAWQFRRTVATSVLNTKSVHAECFLKMNIYSFQEMAARHLFYGRENYNSHEVSLLFTSQDFRNGTF